MFVTAPCLQPPSCGLLYIFEIEIQALPSSPLIPPHKQARPHRDSYLQGMHFEDTFPRSERYGSNPSSSGLNLDL